MTYKVPLRIKILADILHDATITHYGGKYYLTVGKHYDWFIEEAGDNHYCYEIWDDLYDDVMTCMVDRLDCLSYKKTYNTVKDFIDKCHACCWEENKPHIAYRKFNTTADMDEHIKAFYDAHKGD